MTLIIASAHGKPPAVVHGADMIEIRADDIGVDEIESLVPSFLKATSLPTVFTIRSIEEGGNFSGDDAHRTTLLRTALESKNPPKYIDIEFDVLSKQPWLLDELPLGDCGVILSWHDIVGRPTDLFQKAAAMQDVAGISIVKMVWRARSIRDNLDAFKLLQARQQPMISLCMGPAGLMSRVLAPKFGAFATFATIDGIEATADGQPTVQELRTIYNFHSIHARTKVYGVIGEQVEHSASPQFHNAAFAAAGTDAVYLPLPIPSGWEHLKATTLSLLHQEELDFCGASITIPHKEHMLKLVQEEGGEVELKCETIGAANTIDATSTLHATNTDVEAIVSLLDSPQCVLILGAGGVARAAVVAALELSAEVIIVARRNEQAEELSQTFGCMHGANNCENIDTVINCTPVGMAGSTDAAGDPLQQLLPDMELTKNMTVFDTVYMPEQTPLLARANKTGCNIITGSEMFRKQAASQQMFWSKHHQK
jgi:3-dehydroquinate dehydratase/shikimate dehydrogenase